MMLMRCFFRAHAGDHHIDHHLAGMFEGQGQRKTLVFDQLLLQEGQHQMQAARLEHHRGAGRDVDILGRAHFHDAVFHQRFMHHGALGDRGFGAQQAVARGAGIADRHIGDAGPLGADGSPRPGVLDLNATRQRGAGKRQHRQQGQGRNNMAHGFLLVLQTSGWAKIHRPATV